MRRSWKDRVNAAPVAATAGSRAPAWGQAARRSPARVERALGPLLWLALAAVLLWIGA